MFGFQPEFTFIISIVIAIVAFIFRLLFTKKLIPEFSIRQFIKQIFVRSIPIVLISALIPSFLVGNFQPGLYRFTIVFIVSISISIASIYSFGLNKSERRFVKNYLVIYRDRFYRFWNKS